ncbi:MAG TPA: DUF4097 family beta strand repeat-containing protein [Gemmatimonadaceae bacterium]|jgi:hypothetical protein|nr:DUF4097 family beta strand repeat-containing protein [Gemmatimonadaceae bacterium]
MHPTRLVVALFTLLGPLAVRAQYEDRAQNWQRNCEYRGNYDRAHFCELRNFTLRPGARISVDGHENGGVAFFGWDRNEVKIVAMIQTNADDDNQAEALAKQIRISTDGGRINADGPTSLGRKWWSVSYEIYVPRRSNLEAITRNGGVSAADVEGELDLHATNGGIHVENVAGDVHGETTNGGVTASLSGTSWRGKGLDLRTTNGGVNLTIPRGYNASLETGTTNGGMRVDFPITVRGLIGRRIQTQLGTGGPLVRVMTTNGGVRISER